MKQTTKTWEKKFNKLFDHDGGKALVLIETSKSGTTQRPIAKEVKQFIEEQLKEEYDCGFADGHMDGFLLQKELDIKEYKIKIDSLQELLGHYRSKVTDKEKEHWPNCLCGKC